MFFLRLFITIFMFNVTVAALKAQSNKCGFLCQCCLTRVCPKMPKLVPKSLCDAVCYKIAGCNELAHLAASYSGPWNGSCVREESIYVKKVELEPTRKCDMRGLCERVCDFFPFPAKQLCKAACRNLATLSKILEPNIDEITNSEARMYVGMLIDGINALDKTLGTDLTKKIKHVVLITLTSRTPRVRPKDKKFEMQFGLYQETFKGWLDAVDLDAVDSKGRSLLHYACEKCLVEIINTLLTKVVAIDNRDNNNDTPLMLAAKSNCQKGFLLMVLHGADPYLTNVDDKSSLDLTNGASVAVVVEGILSTDFTYLGVGNCTKVDGGRLHQEMLAEFKDKGAEAVWECKRLCLESKNKCTAVIVQVTSSGMKCFGSNDSGEIRLTPLYKASKDLKCWTRNRPPFTTPYGHVRHLERPQQSAEYYQQQIFDTKGEAITAVQNMKSDYGNGVSTLIIIHNCRNKKMFKTDTRSTHGKWTVKPTETIPAGKWMACLHTHTSGAAVGSEGSITYNGNHDFHLSWSTPFIGTNKAKCGDLASFRFLSSGSSPMIRYDLLRDDGLCLK